MKAPYKFIFVLLFTLFLVNPHTSPGEDCPDLLPVVSSDRFPEAFLNEDLRYDLSFLWFNRAAVAHLSFEKGSSPSEYRAVLVAETKGFVGWVYYRKHRYVSIMEMVNTEKGRMLRTRYFIQEFYKWGGREVRESTLDYSNKVMITRESKPGMDLVVYEEVIPDKVIYNDVLSAYYNLRGGVFGVKRKGNTFMIDTIPRKGVSKITVAVANDETERERKAYAEDARFLLKLDIDKRIFGQKNGTVWLWVDKDLVLVMGEVRDVIFFGDVRGYRNASTNRLDKQ